MTAAVQRRWHGGAVAVVATVVAVALAGCGKPAGAAGASPAASSRAATEAQQLKFTQCMRAHGATVQDAQPNTSGGGSFQINGNGADKGSMDAAMQACSKYLPKAGGPPADPAQRQQMLDRALKFSQCMRQHGVNMPDPQMSSDGNGIMMQGGPNGVDPSSQQFQTAQKACEQYFGPPGSKGGQGRSLSTGGQKGDGGGSGVVIGNG
jgi:hypothetical protein